MVEEVTRTVKDLADAIAYAEGFGLKGSVPTRAHNPGDIKVPNWEGAKTGAEGITVFETDEQGWAALYRQLNFIKDGHSHIYKHNTTFAEFARYWTDTQNQIWLNNVLYHLRFLGYVVYGDTTLGDFFNSN